MLGTQPCERGPALLEDRHMPEVEACRPQGVPPPHPEDRRLVVLGPIPVLLQLEIGVAAQAVDDVDDPVVTLARLAVGQPAQSGPELAEGEAHGVIRVLRRDAPDEVS